MRLRISIHRRVSMPWLAKLKKMVDIGRLLHAAQPPQQTYSLTETNHPISDGAEAEEQSSENELLEQEVHTDNQLNREPHLDTNDEIKKMFWDEDQAPHLYFPDIDPATDDDAAGVGYPGYSYIPTPKSKNPDGERKFNLISSKDDVITIEELSEDKPVLASYLSKFGVKTLDREAVTSIYNKLCVEAVRQEKPISEMLKGV